MLRRQRSVPPTAWPGTTKVNAVVLRTEAALGPVRFTSQSRAAFSNDCTDARLLPLGGRCTRAWQTAKFEMTWARGKVLCPNDRVIIHRAWPLCPLLAMPKPNGIEAHHTYGIYTRNHETIEFVRVATKPWSHTRHVLFSRSYQRMIHTIMLVAQRTDHTCEFSLPQELWFLVCSFILRSSYCRCMPTMLSPSAGFSSY